MAASGALAVIIFSEIIETSPELWIVRVLKRMYLGAGLLQQGDVNGGHQAFYSGLEAEKEQSKPFKGAVLMGAAYFHWTTADLQAMGFELIIFNIDGLYSPENLKAFTEEIIPALKG